MAALDPTQTNSWATLSRHRDEVARTSLRTLFDEDPARFDTFSWTVGGLTVDFSKQRITAETVSLLCDLARAMSLEEHRAAMYAGQHINTSEDCAALHVALRDSTDRSYTIDGEDVSAAVAATRRCIGDIAMSVIGGSRTGHTGQTFTRVINIGIGGSDLGPRLAVSALAEKDGSALDVRFVATVDVIALNDALHGADPARTLFVVCSKSFSTQETMANAESARQWLVDTLGKEAVASHFIAVTANAEAATTFGIAGDNVLPLWEWVGGRFSLWSAVGVSVALACGADVFNAMLSGAHAMDWHFETAPLNDNLPMLAGLIGVWNRNFWQCPATAVLPYDHRLHLLPAYFQQMMMESNGKGLRRDGTPVTYGTAPVLFGASGSESQHSIMQLIHQSPMIVSVEFIVSLDGKGDGHRDKLIANAFAQSEALMLGLEVQEKFKESGDSRTIHKSCPGNRPSTTILLDTLTPETLGALLAFYEHRTFVEGTLWGLNSFDQWGVELSKTLAKGLLSDITSNRVGAGRDSSTAGLLATYLARRKTPTS